MEAKLSIWSGYYGDLSPEEAVDEFIKNGIYAFELSSEHGAELLGRSNNIEETGRAFAKYVQERNFDVSQGHLWLSCKMCMDSAALIILYKWIDLYETIGVKEMVLHCDPMTGTSFDDEEKLRRNIEKLKMLAEYIKDKDITICLENLLRICPCVEDLLYIIKEVGSDKFGICLDTGHLNLTKKNTQREFILKAGKKLKALHIADNEGEKDQHMMPFTRGSVNFAEVVKALREVDYHGFFNLEIPGESHIPLELRSEKIRFIKAGYDYLMKV